MINVEERLNYLDGVMAELAHAQLRSEVAMKELKKSMDAHIVEMRQDREESRKFRAEMRQDREENRKDRQESRKDREESRKDRQENRKDRQESRKDREESQMFRVEMRQDRAESRKFRAEMQQDREEMQRDREESRKYREQNQLTIEEMKRDTRNMKKAWGDLANKMGTVAEDVVAPNIPRLALEDFGFSEVEDLLVRVRRASRRGEKRSSEYDVICAGPERVIVVEVKSTPTKDHIQAVPARLAEFFDFYPEYEGRELIGMFASWSIDKKLHPAISEAGLYGLAMGEDTMEIVARPRV